MNNYSNDNTVRRYKAHVSVVGTTQLHLRNPYIIAWWSAAFPGFGHLLLSKYLRGYTLFLWEILVNNMSHLNHAIMYSFTGNIKMAIEIIEPRWLLLYLPVYIFGIWDSYRTSVDMNKVYILAEREDATFNSYVLGGVEINYLDKRSPIMAILWSFLTPGLGQLYIHRVITAIFVMAFTIIFVYFSNFLIAIHLLFLGEIGQATETLNPQWFLFLPSHIGFAVYDAYVNTVENNKLYESEQRNFLKKNYQQFRLKITASQEVK
ncbi:hypothetical protein [Oceanobacillus halophilus]|uniref:Uncharacterized protein n=1 Tax=Oceanobacillus halophilus TaxID=930130 RepID=A0A494ZVD6_9BACI|nr:hypothetical protein [Oceanobacillus halophilus]RKQ30252.1 hypothetical protein D8M06_16305 [Oceanobacillus halophilus]